MVAVYVISEAIKYNGRILVCSLGRSEIGIWLWFPFCYRNLLFSVLSHPTLSCLILSCLFHLILSHLFCSGDWAQPRAYTYWASISSAEMHLSPLLTLENFDTGHGTRDAIIVQAEVELESSSFSLSSSCYFRPVPPFLAFFFKGTIYWIISSHPLEGIPEGITGRDHKEERIKLDSVWLFITLPDSDAKVVYRRHI